MTLRTDVIEQIINEISRDFPIENYIEESKYYSIKVLAEEISKHLSDLNGRKLLDIGCGPMDKTAVFSRLGFSCYAVDDLRDPWHLRNNNLEKMKNFAKNEGIYFHHQKDDFTIPFEYGTFDVVTILEVIEHLHESPRTILNEAGSFLKKNGLLVITMPNSVNLRKRLSVLLGKSNLPPVEQFYFSNGEWRGHVREYTLKETIYICEQNGFEIITSSTFEHLAPAKLKTPLRQIYSLLGTLVPTLKSGILIIARKPASWQPAEYNIKAHRQALSKSVPSGVA